MIMNDELYLHRAQNQKFSSTNRVEVLTLRN